MKKQHIYRVAMTFPMIKHNESNQKDLELIVNEAISTNKEPEVIKVKVIRTALQTLLSSGYIGIFLAAATYFDALEMQATMLAFALLPIFFIAVRDMYTHVSWITFKEEVDYKLFRWEKPLKYLKNKPHTLIMQLAISLVFFSFSLFILATLEGALLWILIFSTVLYSISSYLYIHAHLLGVAVSNYCLLKDDKNKIL